MATGIVDYIDKNDDLSHVGVQASTKEEAEDEARSEHWDISEIIEIHRSR